jgi:serine O-acetyltransferase
LGLKGDIAILFSERGTLSGKPSLRTALRLVLTKAGVQALIIYRFYHALYLKGHTFTAEILARLNLLLTGAEIDPAAEIGSGCHIWHASGLVIGRHTKLGENVWLLNNVTMGGRGASGAHDGEPGYPVIGDNVIIYTGATVLGNVNIGFHSVIGAHSLILSDIPEHSLAVGIPARVIKTWAPGEPSRDDAESV